ncbi:hypothetical protein G6F62_015779 [Rhizopus arrhizus]|nr:hypothetical protein G6F62_015779 [Rhizopus arrhizus]
MDSRAVSVSRSNAGAPVLVSPRSRRPRMFWFSVSPLGSTPRAAACASASAVPALIAPPASVRLRVPDSA